MRFLKYLLGFLGLIALLYTASAKGLFGNLPSDGEIVSDPRPQTKENLMNKQIFFGDLHVHTTFSSDAFFFSLPLLQGEGAHPPADACNFARFCSALDFFSITDHAEGITQSMWDQTIEATKNCNAVSSNTDTDLIAFAGWEWTQMVGESGNPENHYGHKNIILRNLNNLPKAPIGAGLGGMDMILKSPITPSLLLVADFPPEQIDFNFLKYRDETYSIPFCSEIDGNKVKGLECKEEASTPKELFNRLDELNLDALVIPHGTAWGIHAPANSTMRSQLQEQHDPEKQRLFEVYSGHGNSEVYRDIKHVIKTDDGQNICPEPTEGFEPCCWRAGEIAKKQCVRNEEGDCEKIGQEKKQEFVNRISEITRFGIIKDSKPEDWLQCGQIQDEFLPAYNYRPGMTAQAALASEVISEGKLNRFKMGLIGSTDNHKARAGSGYKEFARKAMGDSWGAKDSLTWLLPPERGASFYSTGGLVAVHANSLNRDKIFDSLYEREVYATSGERILLWFNLIHPKLGKIPMGQEVKISTNPVFEVKAAGSFKQKPGCPDYVHTSLNQNEISRLCLNECYNPSTERNVIDRIEVVKIIPSENPENLSDRIQDPWKVFKCENSQEGCEFKFIDDAYIKNTSDTVYYVRAIQEPTLAVGGDPLRCSLDEEGSCVKIKPCYASGKDFDSKDNCLAPIGERAWSSPLFLSKPKNLQ
jgi:hypothetical protein